MSLETLKNIIDFNRKQANLHQADEELEDNMCPYDAWPLKENKGGYKSCEICGRLWLGNREAL